MVYRLWDIETGHLYGAFRDEDEALATARLLIEAHDNAHDIILTREPVDRPPMLPLIGDALIEYIATRQEPELVLSSGNIFADLGLPNPDKLLADAHVKLGLRR